MARPRFRPLRGIGNVLIALLVAQVLVHLLTLDATLDRLSLVDRSIAGERVTFAEIDLVDARMLSFGRWGFLLLIVSAVVWPMWQYQGHANLVRRHVVGLRFSPGWAVGWWFVPIANLWKPFQAMSELAKASADPDAWRRRRRPWVLFPWWLTWLAGTSITRVISMQGSPSTPVAVRQMYLALGFASACTIAAAILAVAIVWPVTDDQERMVATAPPLFEDATLSEGPS